MRRALRIAVLSAFLCSGCDVSSAEQVFHTHEFGTMNFRPQKVHEHPQQDNWIGGLTLIAAENHWPLLFQMPFFDGNYSARGSTLGCDHRCFWWDVQWGYVTPVPLELRRLTPRDQGAFRPVLVRHVLTPASRGTVLEKKIANKDWAHIRYRYEYGDGEILEAVYSRLSPGFLFSATGSEIRLFAHNWVNFQRSGRPDKERGGANWTRLTKKLVAFMDGHRGEYNAYDIMKNIVPWVAYGGQTIDYVSMCLRPTALAWAGPDGIEVRTGNVDASAPGMKEPWLLVWYGGGSPLWAHTMAGFSKRVGGYGLRQMDCPFLLILEHQPKKMVLDKDGLRLLYEKEVGKLIVMPLRGMNFFEAAETEQWRSARAVPEEVVEQCRFWTTRLLDYPLTIAETVELASQRSSIRVTNKCTYESLKGEWKFPRTRISPVSPMVGTAYTYEFPMTFSTEPLNPHYFTRFGDYLIVDGKDEYSYEIRDMHRYVWETLDVPALDTEEERALAHKLDGEVLRMIRAGHLAPLASFRLPYLYQTLYWQSPAELLYSCSLVADYVSPDTRRKLAAYCAQEASAHPPLAGTTVARGAPRALYPIPSDVQDLLEASGENILQMFKKRPEILYQLWWYAEKLNAWDSVGNNWDEIDRLFRHHFGSMDWATGFFGTLRCILPETGLPLGIQDINSFVAGAIGYARMAARLGKEPEACLGYALAAKWLTVRYACARFDESMLAENLIRPWPDMKKPGEWWKENVVDKTGTRQVFMLNQFGPMLDRVTPGEHVMGGGLNCRYRNVLPEIGRFLRDFNRANEQGPLKHILESDPIWYVSGGVLEPKADVCCQNFIAAAYLQCMPSDQLIQYLDEPDCVGDLFYFQKAAAALHASPEARWRSVIQHKSPLRTARERR